MKPRSLLAQVLAVNLLLVAGTMFVATVAVDFHVATLAHGREIVVLVLATVATLLGNWLLLRRRFKPLDRVISAMEHVDLSAPQPPASLNGTDSAEVERLNAAFHRMIGRLEAERREAGRAAIRAQERERRRIAQDLHDEVNQALTAVQQSSTTTACCQPFTARCATSPIRLACTPPFTRAEPSRSSPRSSNW
jgi:two-component system sensor histidine kinase UhpB